MDKKLLFVSNVPSGFTNIAEHARKPFSSKYLCKLHDLTRGIFGTRSEWRKFVHKLDIPSEFLTRDQLHLRYPRAIYKKYPTTISYPCVLLRRTGSIEIIITPAEIETCISLDELKDMVTAKVLALPK